MTDRRIADLMAAEDASAKIAAEIATHSHYGILEGVEIDFRHPLLPLGEWHTDPCWHVWGDGPQQAGVIFPLEAINGGVDDMRSARGICDTFPTIFVRPGDKIKIHTVFILIEDHVFEHLHDKQRKLAYLQITRQDNSIEFLDKPMTFYGATKLQNGPWRLQFDNVIDRIKQHANQNDLSGMSGSFTPIPPEGRPATTEEQAYFAAQAAHRSYFELYDAINELKNSKKAAMLASLNRLANSAAMAALLLSKIEALRANELASKTIQTGRKLGEANANQYWVAEAERLWTENPSLTLNRVAKLISHGDENDKRSIMKSRGVNKACPKSSPSWEKVQKKILDKGW